MKTYIIIATSVLLVIFLLQSFTVMSTNKTEVQKYTVIKKDGNFEIRFYPSATIATVTSNAKTYKELAGPGFRKLAGYIFGCNEKGEKIAMTSPVHMDINDSVSKMSFVMPSSHNTETLPKPNDSNVLISQTPPEYVAVIKFGGYASDNDLKHYTEKLIRILEEKGISANGNYRYLGYNPPYQFIGRKNEIIVSIDWKEQEENDIVLPQLF